MRISSSMQYYNSKENMLSIQEDLYSLQSQLSSGQKVVKPSDDPVAAARILLAQQSINANKQDMSAQGTASSQLAITEAALGNVSNLLLSTYSSAVQGGNGSYSDADRKSIANDLRANLQSLVDRANSRSATGDFVFGGYRSNTVPFSVIDTPTAYAQYNGDGGTQKLQVDSSTTIAVTENGSEVFMRVLDKTGTATGKSVFDTVKDMITYLETPRATAVQADYDKALGNIQAAMDHVERARANVGSRGAMIQNLQDQSEGMDIQYKAILTDLSSLDYAEAISNFKLLNTQLQASQQSFSLIAQNNLFQYL